MCTSQLHALFKFRFAWTRLVFAGPALALLAPVRRFVARLRRYGLEGCAGVGLGLLPPGESHVGLQQ